MTNTPRFSCYIIGADTLLTACGDILLNAGHELRGIITDAPKVAHWAKERGLPVMGTKSDYIAQLKAEPFDFFFAITHLALIPAEVLALPRRMAINFHDGPLPAYAGLNTPVWGLLNREAEWGITWHEMTADIDAGDILEQRRFEIAKDETSLSLNTKNFAAAVESFQELAQRLATHTERRQAQDPSQRTLFKRTDRPAAAGMIDWRKPALEIDAMVRALDFGRYGNPVALPKVSKGAELLCVTGSRLAAGEHGGEPGAVTAIGEESITVATGEGAVELHGFVCTSIGALKISEVVELLGLREGDRLDVLSGDDHTRLTELDRQLARSEPFWEERLRHLEPIEIPFAGPVGPEPRYERMSFQVPEAFLAVAGARASDAVVAAVAVYLSRLGNKDHFHLAYQSAALDERLRGLEAYVWTEVPLSLDLAPTEGFTTTRRRVAEELEVVGKRVTFLKDAITRDPELRANDGLRAGRLPSVGVAQGKTAETARVPRGSLLTFAVSDDGREAGLVWDAEALSRANAERVATQLRTLLEAVAADPDKPIARLDLLTPEKLQRMLFEWNATAREVRRDVCVHQLIEAQAAATPEATALVFEGESLSYRQMNERANQLAAHLRTLGVAPGKLVGVFVERSLELVISVLATLKAGGAYVPLDPAYPKERLAFMIMDAEVHVLLTRDRLVGELPMHNAAVVRIDADWPEISLLPREDRPSAATATDLAYVIYTSGSTGTPKGVQVEHRNVINFFAGMDERIPHDPPGTWLAVTSLSFDISVLELAWTLARGFRVVLFADRDRAESKRGRSSSRGMQFGLFMWGNDDAPGRKKYELMLEGAKFLDREGFSSVWTPERHFHAFGGPYPNPSVTGAALAVVTQYMSIRAGSVVSPLHHPIRIAEEWSVIDNLSDGRVGLSFAAGWQPNDFVLRPESYRNPKGVMFEQIDTVRRLWRGEAIEFENPLGQKVMVTTQPRPVQDDPPFWVTTAGNPDTYREAGAMGANVLTHLLGQSVEEVAGKIRIYRQARAQAGLDPAKGIVTLMLHSFVGEDIDEVRDLVRKPMKDYLGAAVNLVQSFAWAFPAFKRPQGATKPADIDLKTLSAEEVDTILEAAFLRYFEDSGLFGTPESCLEMIDRCKEIDVDEIACLLDFGVSTEQVMRSLPRLARLRALANPEPAKSDEEDWSLAAQLRRFGVTHLQCTPSMARMMLGHHETREALRGVQHLYIGGEALPAELARELTELVPSVMNMYGPTETTIWSSTHTVERSADTAVPIGAPIANTQLYVLDHHQQPVPIGVPGELYIGGEGVVRGYLRRPELTAERFLADPFVGGAARMYRTGDRVRWRADGVVEFLGRTDHQVKIRGYRIELGEIEALIARDQRAVREAVVLVREDVPGDQRLVAYVVPRARDLDLGALKEALRGKLPEFMVPAHYVLLDRLPLTPNGKIDRKALPRPEETEAPALEEGVYVAPENELEAKIAALWQETLGREKVGIDDNFFDIGGHSLLVVKLHRELRGAIEQPVALTDLYRFPTIRSFAAYLGSDGDSEQLSQSASRGARRRMMRGRRG